jgi:hypothetical protein
MVSKAEGRADEDLALTDIVARLDRLQSCVSELMTQIAGATKDYYTVEEFASRTGRAPYTVRHWRKLGLIVAERIQGSGPKGRLLIPRGELEKIVKSGRGENVNSTVMSQSK